MDSKKCKAILLIIQHVDRIITSLWHGISFSEKSNPESNKSNILVKRCLKTLQTHIRKIEMELRKGI
ncbi:hypothetical protein [Legionella bozemanae]|uniref:hypothetical protein n=1 Tax=Legionella bozemanae TaxID=447 RepID=UPI00399D1F4D